MTSQNILFHACKKALKDKLGVDVKDDELFNRITSIEELNRNLDRKEKLKLVLEYYKQSNTNTNTLQGAVAELQLIRNQPILTNASVSPASASTVSASSAVAQGQNQSHPSNYFNISVPPRQKKYLHTFLVNSQKRNWIDNPLRSLFQYEFPKNVMIYPCILTLPSSMQEQSNCGANVVVVKILNMNGLVMEYHLFPNDVNRLVWKTLDNIQPYPVSMNDNIVTIGIYDENDNMLDMGRDNSIRITKLEKLKETGKYRILFSSNLSIGSFTMICRDSVYNFESEVGASDIYMCSDDDKDVMLVDVVGTLHSILVKGYQFSMICAYTERD